MKLAIFANIKRKDCFELASTLARFLATKKVSVYTRDEDAKVLKVDALSSCVPQELDFLISIGGDGSILRLVHSYPELDTPIFGINMGHLGFLTETPASLAMESISELIAGKFRIEKRMMMEGLTPQGERFFAVNDVVIHRSRNPGLIDISIHVDESYLNTFSADGVIVSTACGSTAYSLSAGGPILTPDLQALVITPISAHTISNRPIVLIPKEKIELQYLSRYDPVEINFDGFARYNLSTSEVLTLYKSTKTFNQVSLLHTDFFMTLRTKLGWAGQVRYSQLNHREDERE